MARKTKEEAELTRQRLIDTAQRLFWEKGVSRTSLADIAQAAGVTRGAIYWHFTDKIALFNAMCERIIPRFDELDAKLSRAGSPERAVRCLWQHSQDVLRCFAEHPDMRCVIGILNLRCEFVGEMANVLIMDRSFMTEKFDRLEKIFARADQEGDLLPGLTARQAAHIYHSMARGLIDIWLLHPERIDLSAEADTWFLPFFRGTFRLDSWLPDSSCP
ncbi:TetR family transcriptional regulator [Paludibacterium paludis]|uniref:DNA-binding transcriptional repressor AcrR n=1 Tax=Paludibacterium paludis TaxID=1225769 RepID=A0A918P5Q8_9NEIS|nr:TetR family transcriptional regulator [Paludibacterium paludis]GGY23125.1 DNA-binding transcriptional repressor AcrR [Paludibacterium paludis]